MGILWGIGDKMSMLVQPGTICAGLCQNVFYREGFKSGPALPNVCALKDQLRGAGTLSGLLSAEMRGGLSIEEKSSSAAVQPWIGGGRGIL